MVGFCSCFRSSSAKYDSPANENCDHAACHVVQLAQQAPAAHALATHKQPSSIGHFENYTNGDQNQRTEYAPMASKLASHHISISPERPHAANPDGNELTVDVVRQDDIDNGKAMSPSKAVPAEQLELFNHTPAADTTPAAAIASDAVSWPSGSDDRSKPVKTPGSAGKAARSNSAPGNRAPWGSRSAAAQVTPVKTHSAKPTPHTPSSAPSPSVTRPTCASSARAQAVSANRAAQGAPGTWKF